MCVSSLECFTKAVSSTRCHTVWPIRETRGECACCLHVRVCVRLSFQVDSGGLFSSFLLFSIFFLLQTPGFPSPLVLCYPPFFLSSSPPLFSCLPFHTAISSLSSGVQSLSIWNVSPPLSLGPVQAETQGWRPTPVGERLSERRRDGGRDVSAIMSNNMKADGGRERGREVVEERWRQKSRGTAGDRGRDEG